MLIGYEVIRMCINYKDFVKLEDIRNLGPYIQLLGAQ